MARFDTYQGTQSLPGVRRPQVVADTAVGEATAGFGRQIQQTAGQVGQLAELAAQRQQEVDDFQRKKGWLDFEGQMSNQELEAQQNLEPGAAGYSKKMLGQFDEKAKEFVSSLPESARNRASLDVQSLRNQYANRFARTEYKERTRYFQEGISESTGQLANKIFKDPNSYQDSRAYGRKMIEESGLPKIEKEKAVKAWDDMAALAWIDALPAAERAAAFNASSVDAGSLIREKEGFRTAAYWDVNHYRVGYGSDTVTKADGSVVKVTKDTVITQADAERDLDRRIAEFQFIAIKQVGADAWQSLPARAQAALTSITYNYGELPGRLHAVVKSGDLEKIATAVENLRNDNGGVNSKRRQEEADIIRGKVSIPNAPPGVQEALDRMSYEDQVKLSDQAHSDLLGVASDRQDTFKLSIAQDPLTVDRDQILDDPILDDGQKATLIKSLDAALKSGEDKRQAVNWANAEGAGNPLDPADRKSAELVYNSLIENEQATPDQAADTLAAGKGVVPKSYVNLIRNGLRSQNANDVAMAYSRAAATYELYPQAVRGAENGTELEDAATKWRLFRNNLGLTAEEAGARLAEMNSPEAMKNRADLLESAPVQKYLKEVDADDLSGMLKKRYHIWGPKIGANPKGQANALSEFKELFKESLGEVGGEVDLAEKLAFDRWTRTWGTSEFSPQGDGVALKYPVEKLYPAVGEGGHQYIRDQIEEDLAAEKIEAKDFYLVGNEYTESDWRSGRPPRMTLQYVDKDGVLQQAPYAFTADVQAAEAAEKARKDAELQAKIKEHEATKEYRLNQPTRYEGRRSIKAKPTAEWLQDGLEAFGSVSEAYQGFRSTVSRAGQEIGEAMQNTGRGEAAQNRRRGGDQRSKRSKRKKE